LPQNFNIAVFLTLLLFYSIFGLLSMSFCMESSCIAHAAVVGLGAVLANFPIFQDFSGNITEFSCKGSREFCKLKCI